MREFYVHLLNDVSTIESFGSSMQRCYNDKTPALPKWRLKKDLACVAQFSVDKNYYRAKIKVVGVDDCLIQFVDYGNYTWMSKGKILPLITKFGKMPPAAYKCTMKGNQIYDLNLS